MSQGLVWGQNGGDWGGGVSSRANCLVWADTSGGVGRTEAAWIAEGQKAGQKLAAELRANGVEVPEVVFLGKRDEVRGTAGQKS